MYILTCSRSMKELETLAGELERTHGITCLPVQADMGCEADVERASSFARALVKAFMPPLEAE